MQFIDQYDLYLFDFDGLLVDTEKIHYAAYAKTFRDRDFEMIWSFSEYIEVAHYSSEGLQQGSYAALPELYQQQPDWSVIYKEKTKNYLELVAGGAAELMPGAEEFLTLLLEEKLCAVVTHSGRALIESIRSYHSILQKIPHWFTREDYEKAKPEPDGYLKAVETLGKKGDRVVGFEDSPRGMKALVGAGVDAVFVTEMDYPEIAEFTARGARHVHTFENLIKDLH